MSERTHSSSVAQPRKKLIPVVSGTLVAVAIAGAAFQFYRAEPGVAQTRDAVGTATVNAEAGTSEILARVNNHPISYEEVARECFERHGKDVLDNIINRKMIEQACQNARIQITQQEIEQEIISVAKKFNIDVANWYALLQNERNITPAQYQRDVIFPMLALKKLAGKNVQVTNQDMQRAFVRDYGPRVEARMILLEGNQRQAARIWETVKADPDNFHRFAQEYSADPNTKPLGGAVPPIRRYGGSEKIEEVAFSLKVGEISPLIEIAEGRHVILKCEGHTKPVVTDIREVWDELHARLVEEKTQELVAKKFEDIRTSTTIINHVTGETIRGNENPYTSPTEGIQPVSGVETATRQPVRSAAFETGTSSR